MPENMQVKESLDARGLKCPMPVLKTKLAIKNLAAGEILEVISNDRGSANDIPAWAKRSGNKLLKMEEEGESLKFYIEKVEKTAEEAEKAPERAPGRRRMLLICSKGTLDMAYPPLILATTAAAMDVDVSIFFTFYGLDIINRHKYRNLKVAPLGNPAMPMPVPNAVGAIPGMTAVATMMMKKMMKDGNVPSIPELIKEAKSLGVKLIGCQMTMDVMGVKKEDLIEEVDETVGAATFVSQALDADLSMFI